MGGRHVEVRRTRVRTADREDAVQLSYEHFADGDPLARRTRRRLAAPVPGTQERSARTCRDESVLDFDDSRSSAFIERTREGARRAQGAASYAISSRR